VQTRPYKMLQRLRLEGPLLSRSGCLCSIYYFFTRNGNDLSFCT